MLAFLPKGGLPTITTPRVLSISTVRKSAVSMPGYFGSTSYAMLPAGSRLKNDPVPALGSII
jgi:hypothetical protein